MKKTFDDYLTVALAWIGFFTTVSWAYDLYEWSVSIHNSVDVVFVGFLVLYALIFASAFAAWWRRNNRRTFLNR